MSKQPPVPVDFDLRREYFQKFSASALHDAHLLAVYIDEQLAQECGMTAPMQLLAKEPFSKCGMGLTNFTNNGAFNPEALPALSFTQNNKMSALMQDAGLYYGFWGTIYNTVLDNKPAETYDLIQQWIDVANRNFDQVFEAAEAPEGGKKPKRPPTSFVITSLTDSEAVMLLKDTQVAELQGSVRQFVCARRCSTEQQSLDDKYRFAVQADGRVDTVVTRVGQNLADPSLLQFSPLYGILQREYQKLSKPEPKKVEVKAPPPKKEAKKFDKDGKEIKPKKKKVPLSTEGYCKPEQVAVRPTFIAPELSNQPVSRTCPECGFCAAPLRFNIQPCKLPVKYKQFVSGSATLLTKDLCAEQLSRISAQHNNYQQKVNGKMQAAVKTLPQYHFVLLEIGYNRAYQKIHDENVKAVLAMKGNGILIRIAKPSDEAKVFEFEGIESVKTNLQLDANFNINNYCYLIESNNIRQGVVDLMDMYESRASWISDWDDIKKRNATYFPKVTK